jgi:hypothetical protein
VLIREEESWLKKISNNNPEGRRLRGRPKQRRWDQVRLDMQRVGATDEDVEDLGQSGEALLVCLNITCDIDGPGSK